MWRFFPSESGSSSSKGGFRIHPHTAKTRPTLLLDTLYINSSCDYIHFLVLSQYTIWEGGLTGNWEVIWKSDDAGKGREEVKKYIILQMSCALPLLVLAHIKTTCKNLACQQLSPRYLLQKNDHLVACNVPPVDGLPHLFINLCMSIRYLKPRPREWHTSLIMLLSLCPGLGFRYLMSMWCDWKPKRRAVNMRGSTR